MANNTGRFARRRGFLTLWALFFLTMVSLFIGLLSVAQAARRETTNELIRSTRQSTRRLEQGRPRDVKHGRSPKQRQRLLE
ncbi:hypothetical protein [Levilactobacillus paucivorans]|nr:hypothetical protein [Levilactobacillus paucivorans]